MPRLLKPRYLKRIISRRYTPRWIILLIDLFLAGLSFVFAWFLRFNFSIPESQWETLLFSIGIVLAVRLVSYRLGATYSGIIRYTGVEDAQRIFFTILGGTVFLTFLNFGWNYSQGTTLIPTSVIIIDFVLCILLLTSYRLSFKIFYHNFLLANRNLDNKHRIAIYGAGRSGLITKRSLDQDGDINSDIVAFIDDDPQKNGKYLEGTEICSSEYLEDTLTKKRVDQLIISIQRVSASKKETIVNRCLGVGVNVKVTPPVNMWINGELNRRQIQNVRIEDLMSRDPIQLDIDRMRDEIKGKVLMVTGASGSIGRELVHQLASYNPEKIVMVDIGESSLHELQLEMEDKGYRCDSIPEVADVRNNGRMEVLMKDYRPQLIYHAAAYKHVPLMEACPSEAVMTNIYGTKVMSELAYRYNAEKFVFVSTDKAVNPTNVMGASKRIAEIYVQSLYNHIAKSNGQGCQISYITTRFGNVLGSNGSVIPRFRKQISNMGPVTVTHPDISRYFMTIPEACQLIIEAGSMGEGGEIYLFDMGEPVKIVDLARKMIKLAGFEPEKEIRIEYSGLRPGEKIKEELLAQKENTIPTHHSKIMIAKVDEYCYEDAETKIDNLIALAKNYCDEDQDQIVELMKEIVPEFKSRNSRYEKLDEKTPISH